MSLKRKTRGERDRSEDTRSCGSVGLSVRKVSPEMASIHMPSEERKEEPKCIRPKRVTEAKQKVQELAHILEYIESDSDPKGMITVSDSGAKGLGVFALQFIPKGAFVCEYVGQLIDRPTALAREALNAERKECYVLWFRKADNWWCIDATHSTGRFGRYINHNNASPNCKPEVVDSPSGPHLIIKAMRDITPLEELSYDYNETRREVIADNEWLRKIRTKPEAKARNRGTESERRFASNCFKESDETLDRKKKFPNSCSKRKS